jgi:protein SFI1
VNTSQSFQYLDVKIDKLYADINILFQIVSDAQQSPHPPVKALFAAYDKVLAEHGIAHQHDQRFFRYVLRLGEGASHNTRSLMVRLRKLLAKLDIHIVVQDDPNAVEDEEDDLAQDNVRPTKELGQSSATRGRRASFNDTRLDETWLSGGRLDPARSGNSPHASLDGLSRRRPSANAPHAHNGEPSRGRVAAQHPSQPPRSHSLSTQGSVRAARPPAPEPWSRQQPPLDYQNGLIDDDETESDIPSSPPALPSHYQAAYQHIRSRSLFPYFSDQNCAPMPSPTHSGILPHPTHGSHCSESRSAPAQGPSFQYLGCKATGQTSGS